VRRILREIFPVEKDGALAWPQQTARSLEQRALACPIGSNQGDNLTFVNSEGDTLESVNLSVIRMKVFDFK